MAIKKSSQKIDFLLVTALPEERDALLKLITPTEKIINNTQVIFLGKLINPKLGRSQQIAIIMLPQMGNVDAGIFTTIAIDYLQPDYVFMVGIAGGVKGKTGLGDVLISTEVIYYEPAKLTPDGPQIRQRSIPADPTVLQCAQNYLGSGWTKYIEIARPDCIDENHLPQVHFIPIAAGEKVIADSSQIERLLQIHPKITGVEMESFGVASAALNHSLRPRFISIRTVCDYADHNKNDQWHDYACATAAAYVIGFLLESPITSVFSVPSHSKLVPKVGDVHVITLRHLSMQPVSKQSVLNAVRKEYLQASLTDLYINQTDLYQEECLVDPSEAVTRQINIAKDFDKLTVDHTEVLVAYFGLAHIPLLFHLGYRLTNKRMLEFFELNRFDGHWELLKRDCSGLEIYLEGLPTFLSTSEGDIILRLSVSNTIGLKDVESIVQSPIASIHLFLQPTHRDAVTCIKHLHYFGEKFRSVMDAIHEFFPNRQRVHIFYAGPMSLAVYLGQLVHPGVDRNVIVYNYCPKDEPRYSWGLQITEDRNSKQFLKINASTAMGE